MKKQLFSVAVMAIFASTSLALSVDQASARGFHRTVSAQGSNGRGYTKNVNRNCSGGTCTGERSVQTNGGYGYTSSHNRTCASGSCTGSTTVTGNNGNVWTRSGGATNNGNGTGNWYSTTTGPNGGSVSRSGSVSVNPPQD
jgi:hypothetical protein